MRVSNLNFSDSYLPQINQLQSEENQLEAEAGSGLSVTQPEDNPTAMNQTLNLQTDAAANSQYQSNISTLQTAASNVSNALTTLQPIIEQANTLALDASNSTTSDTQLATDASQVASLIQQALQVANSTDGEGNYLFGGTNSGAQPFLATTDANGNVTAVTYQGNSSVNNVAIGPNVSLSAQVPGENNTGSGAQGLFADSRSGADIFSHLIQLQQDLTAASTGSSSARSAINSTDLPNIQKDEDHITDQIGANGVVQSTLESTSNSETQVGTTISTQISNDTSANLSQVLSKLSQTQTAYQAALESGVYTMNLSILQYLG